MVVSQLRPALRPSSTAGTTSTEPSDVGSKVKLPNATGPEPGTPTSSQTSALSNSSRSHFSPAANRSCPAVSVTFATVPQPTMPSPRRTQASAVLPKGDGPLSTPAVLPKGDGPLATPAA